MEPAWWDPDAQWPQADEASRPVVQELRIAASFSGGVSLAVWMGGLTYELDRLLRSSDAERARRNGLPAPDPGDECYAALLALLRIDADVDVITGTSAGGINGAALATARVHGSRLDPLLGIWLDRGSFTTLLRDIDEPSPASLLQGDGVLLEALRQGLDDIVGHATAGAGRRTAMRPEDAEAFSSRGNPLTLLVTSTLMRADTTTVRDALGTAVFLQDNQALFTFRQEAGLEPSAEAFDPAQLARAARSSASYPAAFEPSFVSVGAGGPEPDMGPALGLIGSRWMIDGGLRNNQPVGTALRAIWDQPAGQGARRVMLHIVPDPGDAGTGTGPAQPGDVPNLVQALGATAKAPFVQSWSADLKESRRRSRNAGRRDAGTAALTDALAATGVGSTALLAELRAQRPAWIVADFVTALDAQYSRLLAARGEMPGVGLGRGEGSAAYDALRADCRRRAAQHWSHPLEDPATPQALAQFGPDLFNAAFRMALRWIRQQESAAPAGQRADYRRAAVSLHRARLAERQTLWERDHLRRFLIEALHGQSPPHDVPTAAAVFARWLEAAFPTPAQLGQDGADRAAQLVPSWQGLLGWASGEGASLGLFGAPDGPAATEQLLLRGAAWLLLAGDERDDLEVDLVQMSAYTRTLLAPEEFATPAKKLTGVGLAHFGAFATRACRANDWMWGRLDGAGWLVHLLLAPRRLRAIAEERYGSPDEVRRVIDEDLRSIACHGDEALLSVWNQRRSSEALRQEIKLLAEPEGDLPDALPELAMLVAYGLQRRIAAATVPVVADALVRPEAADGPRPRLSDTDAAFVERVHAALPEGSDRVRPEEVARLLRGYQLPETAPLRLLARPELRATALGALAVGSAAVDHGTPEQVPVLKKTTGGTTRLTRGLANSIRSDTPAGWAAAGMLGLGILLLIIGGPVLTAVGLPLLVTGAVSVTTTALGRPGILHAVRRWVLPVGGVAGIAAGGYVALRGISDASVGDWVAQSPWFDVLLAVGVALVVIGIAWAVSRLLRTLGSLSAGTRQDAGPPPARNGPERP